MFEKMKAIFRKKQYRYRHTEPGRWISKAEYDLLPKNMTVREAVK